MTEITDSDARLVKKIAKVREELVRKTTKLIAAADARDLQILKDAAGVRTDTELMEVLHMIVYMSDPSSEVDMVVAVRSFKSDVDE